MTTTDSSVVQRTLTVEVPKEQAFATFTERFGDFKPPALAAPVGASAPSVVTALLHPLKRRSSHQTRGASRWPRAAFSLIEITVVFAAMMLLVAIGVPSYLSWQRSTMDSASVEVLRNVSERTQNRVAAASTEEAFTLDELRAAVDAGSVLMVPM